MLGGMNNEIGALRKSVDALSLLGEERVAARPKKKPVLRSDGERRLDETKHRPEAKGQSTLLEDIVAAYRLPMTRRRADNSFLPQAVAPARVFRASNGSVVIDSLIEAVRSGDHSIVPFGRVDAGPLVRSKEQTMLSICHHLRRVMDGAQSNAGVPALSYDTPPWMSLGTREDRAEAAWRSLSHALAAMTSSLHDRAPMLDLDEYAVEMEVRSGWIARFDSVFSEFMDRLLDEYCSSFRTRAAPLLVFVVVARAIEPTDHIEAAMSVLRHERLAYVITDR